MVFINGQIGDGCGGVVFGQQGTEGHIRQLLGCQNITLPDHPAAQHHRAGGRVGQGSDANACQIILGSEILLGKAVNAVAIHLGGHGGAAQRQNAAHSDRKAEKTGS